MPVISDIMPDYATHEIYIWPYTYGPVRIRTARDTAVPNSPSIVRRPLRYSNRLSAKPRITKAQNTMTMASANTLKHKHPAE